jgi:hypothetical protein
MLSYFAYGLGIHSDFPLPEFVPANVEADVIVRFDSAKPPVEMLERDAHVELQPTEATLAFRQAGVFRIREGREILIFPAQEADQSLIRLYLVGKVMATLLYQRGLLVLHASAVELDGWAVVFVGHSGSGKSSLAASLHACGHKVIADDVVAVDLGPSVPSAIPGFPQVKLDCEFALSLGHDTGSLILLHPLESKRGLRVVDRFAATPRPLGLIYLLGSETEIGTQSTALQPQDVLIEFVRHSFPARLLCSGGALHLHQCASLAKRVPVRRFTRTAARIPPAELARRIQSDLAASDQPTQGSHGACQGP